MKVFCNGAQMKCGYDIIVTHKMNEYILAQSDIYLSDCNFGDHDMQQHLADMAYKNVTVVIMRDDDEYDEWPHMNIGKWPYRLIFRRQHEFSLDPLIAFTMAEECDEGFFAWDGTDIEVFFGMLAFLGYGKKCSIYNTKSRDITDINRIDGFLTYITAERNDEDKSDVALFYGDIVDSDVLFGYDEVFGEMLDTIMKNKKDKLYKNDLKIMICKSKTTIKKKRKLVKLLAEKEDIFCELIRKTAEWKCIDGNKEELRSILMRAYEHSFRNASIDLYAAEAWIDQADGSNDDIVMYLWECAEYNGKYRYVPVGMYADIDEAIYYLEVMASNGGKIEVWERRRESSNIVYFRHRLTFYTDDTELKGFEFMRPFQINDHDPMEPESYTVRNRHYMYEEGDL